MWAVCCSLIPLKKLTLASPALQIQKYQGVWWNYSYLLKLNRLWRLEKWQDFFLLFSLFHELCSFLLPRMPGFPAFFGARKKTKQTDLLRYKSTCLHIAPNTRNSPLCYELFERYPFNPPKGKRKLFSLKLDSLSWVLWERKVTWLLSQPPRWFPLWIRSEVNTFCF